MPMKNDVAPMGPLDRAEAHLNTALEEVTRILTSGARNNAETIKLQLMDALEEIKDARAIVTRIHVLESAVAQLQGFEARRKERELAALRDTAWDVGGHQSPGGEFATYDVPRTIEHTIDRWRAQRIDAIERQGRIDHLRIGALERVVEQLGPPHLEKAADAPSAEPLEACAAEIVPFVSDLLKKGADPAYIEGGVIAVLKDRGAFAHQKARSGPLEALARLDDALDNLQCRCSVAERDSGHLTDCNGPDVDDALAALRAALSVSTSAPKETSEPACEGCGGTGRMPIRPNTMPRGFMAFAGSGLRDEDGVMKIVYPLCKPNVATPEPAEPRETPEASPPHVYTSDRIQKERAERIASIRAKVSDTESAVQGGSMSRHMEDCWLLLSEIDRLEHLLATRGTT